MTEPPLDGGQYSWAAIPTRARVKLPFRHYYRNGTCNSHAREGEAAFEFTLRNVELSYNHHKEAASVKLIATDDDGKLFLSDETDRGTDRLGTCTS